MEYEQFISIVFVTLGSLQSLAFLPLVIFDAVKINVTYDMLWFAFLNFWIGILVLSVYILQGVSKVWGNKNGV